MKRRIAAVAVIVMVLTFAVAGPVTATSPPDSAPTVESINVYRNLLETGDAFFLLYVNVPYATPPTTPIDSTFIWRLNGYNALEYEFVDNGYGWNIVGFYFNAAAAITWDNPYSITLSGSPTAFSSPLSYTYQVAASDYTDSTTQADNQQELSTKILDICTSLTQRWGLDLDQSLIVDADNGTALSTYGQTFVRGAIRGAQAMAPYAFPVIVNNVTAGSRAWNTTYSNAISNQWAGTWIHTAQLAGAALFHSDFDLSTAILLCVLVIALIIGNVMVTGSFWNALVDVAFILVLTCRLGLYGMGFLLLIAAGAVVYGASRVWKPFG